MNTQIKVEKTRMHKIPRLFSKMRGFNSIVGIPKWQEVPVAEGKLVLVECKSEEALIVRVENGINVPLYYFVRANFIAGKYYKPIIISETEKIEVGDWVLGGPGDEAHNEIWQWDGDSYISDEDNKILALPEHFSPKHLQSWVDGKIKDGDRILIECESIINDEVGTESYRQHDHYVIKLNQSNHITLHKVEEKMIPFSKVLDLFDLMGGYKTLPNFNIDKWFEQNLK